MADKPKLKKPVAFSQARREEFRKQLWDFKESQRQKEAGLHGRMKAKTAKEVKMPEGESPGKSSRQLKVEAGRRWSDRRRRIAERLGESDATPALFKEGKHAMGMSDEQTHFSDIKRMGREAREQVKANRLSAGERRSEKLKITQGRHNQEEFARRPESRVARRNKINLGKMRNLTKAIREATALARKGTGSKIVKGVAGGLLGTAALAASSGEAAARAPEGQKIKAAAKEGAIGAGVMGTAAAAAVASPLARTALRAAGPVGAAVGAATAIPTIVRAVREGATLGKDLYDAYTNRKAMESRYGTVERATETRRKKKQGLL